MLMNSRFEDFSPYGYDERQFGSPGINLPVGRLTRSVNGGYAEYHTSADNLEIVDDRGTVTQYVGQWGGLNIAHA